jgi:hypothetical protein
VKEVEAGGAIRIGDNDLAVDHAGRDEQFF